MRAKAQPRDSTKGAPAGATSRPSAFGARDLHQILRRVPRRRPPEGRPGHRTSDRTDVRGGSRRAGGCVGRHREDARNPPDAAGRCRSLPERRRAVRRRDWIRSSLKAYEAEHAGDPGRVTVRRLTSGEYAYAIHDLTGIDVKVGVDASSDSVGGEGFTNFGDVQFVQDQSIERYLEAAQACGRSRRRRRGPARVLRRSRPDRHGAVRARTASTTSTRREGSGWSRVKAAARSASIGTARPSTSRGTTSTARHSAIRRRRFAGSQRRRASWPLRGAHLGRGECTDRRLSDARRPWIGWRSLPAPTSDVTASLAKARAGCDEINKALIAWPIWFFARGALAAGGAGDESPLMFDDRALRAEPTHHYTYALGAAGGRGRGARRLRPGRRKCSWPSPA